LYLNDEKENALALLEQLEEQNWDNDSIDSLLDKAKIFHDLGLHERSQAVLDQIGQRCKANSDEGEIFLHYINQEKAEKSSIKVSSKELNNTAVDFYQKGDIDSALETFSKAFTLMPKNLSIALNLLQVISAKGNRKSLESGLNTLLKKCIARIENATLTDEQQERYHKIRVALDGV
jgi:tetratricopeptide (TPR) repeat protein